METIDLRVRLAEARLMLLFTPALCGARDPLVVLESVLDHVDVIQVRPKPLGELTGPTEARAALDWSRRVLELTRRRGAAAPLVLVNDRVDVAAALAGEGLAGVHLGQADCPVSVARDELGPAALIGLSTHTAAQVVAAGEEPIDYLGFGPAFASPTKGYVEGRGAERVWIADAASHRPLFAIGGIDATNVLDLVPVRRVAVASSILSAPEPPRAARELRALLEG